MVKNGIQPLYAITDPTTFEKIQDALFEYFCPNEKPNRDAFTIELQFPFIGTLPLSRGMGNDKPYLFFIHSAPYNEPKKREVPAEELATTFDNWVKQ